MAVWHNISCFYTLYMWCVITLVTCKRLYGCNTIHGHNTNNSIVGHIKAQNVNYYCNGPKDGPVNGLKHLVWCIWNLSTIKKKVSIRTFPVLSSYNLDFLISLHTSELNNNFYVLYIFIPIAYLHFCYWFVISYKIQSNSAGYPLQFWTYLFYWKCWMFVIEPWVTLLLYLLTYTHFVWGFDIFF